MTHSVTDLGPRIDTKPAARTGESRGSADAGAAFADAVDEAVGQTGDRPGAPHRAESGRDDGRHGDDRRDTAHDDSDQAGAATTVIWALIPRELHGAPTHSGGTGRHSVQDRLDGAGAMTRATRYLGAAPSEAAARGAEAEAVGKSAAPVPRRPGADADTQALRAAAVRPSAAPATGIDPSSAAKPTPTVPVSGPADGAKLAPGAAADTAAAARGTGVHPLQPPAGAATTPPTSPTAPPAAAANAPANPAAHGAAGAPAMATAVTATAPASSDARPRDAAGPGAAGRTASYSAGPALGATTDKTVGPTTNAAASATSAAANQISPTAVHVPTAVAATVNSTPVAAATPPPTPFAQAQPDMANILAQLRGRTDGTYQLRAQVHPAELGAVAITATVHHGALSLTLTPDQAAQQAISQSLPQLRQHLADQGFTGVNVGLGSPHQSGHEGQGDGDRQARAQGSDHSVRHGKDTAVGAVDHPSIVRTGGTLSALDLML